MVTIPLLLLVACAVGLYMAWSIGANDIANAMATAVGARAITLRQAVLIASIFTFIGATFVGTHVTETIRKGIINPTFIPNPKIMILGALSSLLAAAIWVTLATWKAMPVSTTHSIVGALVGFGLLIGGPYCVNWKKIVEIVASWVMSPAIAGVFSFFTFKSIVKFILNNKEPASATIRLVPFYMGIAFFIMALAMLLNTRLGKFTNNLVEILGVSLIIAGIAGMIGYHWVIGVIKSKSREIEGVEESFRRLQVITSCYVAFSIGANDVANAMGPVATIFCIIKTGTFGTQVPIPFFILVLGGVGISIGVLTWGYRVMETIGFKITELTNTRGYSIDFGGATSVILATKLGMPVSTTHAAVGSVIGVGLARGLDAVDFGVVRKILISWVITLPIAALTSVGIYTILQKMVSGLIFH
ncbi:MAG: inorganic phosphate transporter [bacterium]|nr:inorganic phosphate transporter [bacterium]